MTLVTMDCLMSDAADFILDSHNSAEDQRLFYERASSMGATSCGLDAFPAESAFTKMRQSIIRSVNERYCNRVKISPTITSSKRGQILYEEQKEDFVVVRQKSIEVTYFTSNKTDDMIENWSLNSCDQNNWNSSLYDANMRESDNKSITDKDKSKSVDNISKVGEVDIFDVTGSRNECRITPQSNKDMADDSRKYIGLDENSFKLAQRSQSIFENCSTYNIPDIQRNVPFNNKILSKNFESLNSAEVSINHKEIDNKYDSIDSEPEVNEHSIRYSKKHSDFVDEQISLEDSFFDRHNSRNYNKPTTANHQSKCSHETKLSSELPTENYDVEDQRGSYSPLSETIANNRHASANSRSRSSSHKRRHKKSRKRNRKKKTKDPPTYECSTCGVSYVISSKKLEVNNRCFHCDFWISVEPVFLKVEKHSWNTCRIS